MRSTSARSRSMLPSTIDDECAADFPRAPLRRRRRRVLLRRTMIAKTGQKAVRLPAKRHMLVLDTAYTWKILNARNIASIVSGRDNDGWFDHVWTVHPVAGLLEPED